MMCKRNSQQMEQRVKLEPKTHKKDRFDEEFNSIKIRIKKIVTHYHL